MEKTIKLGEKELKLKSSLFTIISYKSTFGTDLFEDISNLSTNDDKESNNITQVIKVLFQIIYILHKPYTKASFEDFINDFDFSILSDTKAIEDITNVISEVLGTINNKSGSQIAP